MTIPGIGEITVNDLLTAVSAKQPTPGGGASAAVTAALGCATAAMACRYTTGLKWAAVEAEATALAEQLDIMAHSAIAAGDADARAFGGMSAARATKQPEIIASAEAAAARIPAQLIALCDDASTAIATFRSRCNPRLVSDIDTGLHLLAAAAAAAQATWLANAPLAETQLIMAQRIAAIQRRTQP